MIDSSDFNTINRKEWAYRSQGEDKRCPLLIQKPHKNTAQSTHTGLEVGSSCHRVKTQQDGKEARFSQFLIHRRLTEEDPHRAEEKLSSQPSHFPETSLQTVQQGTDFRPSCLRSRSFLEARVVYGASRREPALSERN